MLLQRCKQSLLKRKINPASTVEYEINGELHTLSLEWIVSAYLKTERREFFMQMLEKVLKKTDADIEAFFQQMGQLILMSALSKNDLFL